MGKALIVKGEYGDMTPFCQDDGDEKNFGTMNPVPKIVNELKRLGLHPKGQEAMYNGKNGRMLESLVFGGPIFYHRLKHLVSDKIHARAYGNVQMMCLQPVDGRSRDGGLKIGENISPSGLIIIISLLVYRNS